MSLTPLRRMFFWLLLAPSCWLAGSAQAADEDALNLEADAPKPVVSGAGKPRLLVEAALGRAQPRQGGAGHVQRRLSLDYGDSFQLGPQARFVLSDRLDLSRPEGASQQTATNTMREAYVSWQAASGDWAIDAGRLNLRHGPSYGFNPTDFFRRGALRSLTSPDPMALRENRQGTVMLRTQALWANGAVSAALAPKLDNKPSSDSFDLDLGSTNAQDRLLVSWSQRWTERVSSQLLWLGERRSAPLLGASATALLSDRLVGFAEWSGGRRGALLPSAAGPDSDRRWRNQWATGGTLSLPTQLSLTFELDYNGRALTGEGWQSVASGNPVLLGPYLQSALFNQDSVSERAWMLYATQKSLPIKNTDLTALLRRNQGDGSWFAFMELRHHWPSVDLALRWQRAQGSALSEYGLLDSRHSVQLLLAWFL